MTLARFAPWRSARLGWAAAAVLLLAGVPPFLRMPPWCDLTLYDLAARSVATGGVHYRDVFDTNPPGFVWALVAIRAAFGPSVEAVRAVDLVIVAAVVGLLLSWARRAGASPAAVAWAAAWAAAFYPFASEFNHCQRDVWMMLPAVGVGLRRVSRAADSGSRSPFLASFLEGVALGCGAWVKPHVLFPAAAVWLATAPRIAGVRWRAVAVDFAGNLVGGLLVLAAGLGWLVGSGAWPHFVTIWTEWNPGYLRMVLGEIGLRANDQFFYFPPWSAMQPVALALAAADLIRGPRDGGLPRVALSAFYLGWTAQAFVLQRGFPYAHVPETLLMLAVYAGHGWAAGFAGIALAALASGVVAAGAVPSWVPGRWVARHPLADPARNARWVDCWRAGLPPRAYAERRNGVGFQVDHFAGIDWVQLGEVSEFLRLEGARDGEVIAWHDSPHAVYLLLGVEPGFRFMHVSTVTGIGDHQYEMLRDELHAAVRKDPRSRFAVADLERVFHATLPGQRGAMAEAADDLLPPAMRARFPRVCRQFPWDQPAVFRSAGGRGRYVVVRIDGPVGGCRIPKGLGEDLPESAPAGR